jgi:hypothetical protein
VVVDIIIGPTMDSFYVLPWPQQKNYIARPSVKSLIQHSCSNHTQSPAPLDPSLLLMHERGLKDVSEAREQAKVPATLEKLEAELVEAENALKKNRWSKVDDKKAWVERLKREIQEAKGKHILTSERLAALEKRYEPVKAIVEEHRKIVEIYERYMKNRTEYYGLNA